MASDGPPLGRILTFYSYKGGTGRSMAVANIAWVLACAGRRVLTIDWDLEAPGLHRYFQPFLVDEELAASDGLIDLVDNYANEAIRPLQGGQTADPDWYLPFTDFSNYIVSINFPHFRTGGKIDFLPAGRQGDHYALAVSSFNWQNFYDRLGGGGFFEAVKQRARSEYDYVIIDSRTGVSDTAGICSVQMPDSLVVCFTYNNQSIKGAAAIARSAVAMHDKLVDEKLTLHRAGKGHDSAAALEQATRPYRVFPVPMRVDSGESERLAIRQAFARHSFADFVDHIGADAISEYWRSVEVPHTSFYSYEEVLAPFKDDAYDPKTVLAALLRLTRYVTDRDVTDFQMPIAPEQKQAFLDAFAETSLMTGTRAVLSRSQRESEEETLARTADAALATLTDAEQLVARRVLGRVIRLGRKEDGERDIPIRTSLGDFQESEVGVIRTLASHRVLTIEARQASQNEHSVGLADARLLTSWRALIDWLEQDREFLLWRQQLRTYLTDWERSGRDAGALLSGRLLSEADLATVRRRDDLNASEIFYIDQSRRAAAPPRDRAATVVRTASPVVTETAVRAAVKNSPKSTARLSGRLMWATAAVVVIALVALAVRRQILSTRGQATVGSTAPVPVVPTPVVPPVKTPAFVGMTASDARKAAEVLDLKVLMTDGRSAEAPFLDGLVLSQRPPSETPVPPGETVHLTIATQTTAAPTIVGLDLAEALRAIDAARLKLGKTDRRYVADTRPGTVITQTPAAGIRAAAGSPVDVVVARAVQVSDFRVGIYFVDRSDESRKLADRLRVFLREAGSDGTLVPRPAEFFTGRFKPTGNEIRYSTPTEKQVADQLNRLFQSSNQFPRFATTLVGQRSEGFLSIFLEGGTAASAGISLTIQGYPGDDVQLWYRGDRDTGEAPIIFTGKLGSDGRVVVTVPRAYIVLGRPTRQAVVPLDLSKERGSIKTIELPRTEGKQMKKP